MTVRLSLACDNKVTLPFVTMVDRVPVLADRTAGDNHAEGTLAFEQPLELSYRIECPAPGRLRFEGVKLLVADLHGFFTQPLFVRKVQVYRVLPALADARGHLRPPSATT